MPVGKKKYMNSKMTPLDANRNSTGSTPYGKNKGDQETTALNPALSKQNAKGVLKQGTGYKLGY